jgi:metal-responsive CopG/Arc/MetJ family transcriptional regulator
MQGGVMMQDVSIIAMAMPKDQLEKIEKLLKKKGYSNIQEFFDDCLSKEIQEKVTRYPFFDSMRRGM